MPVEDDRFEDALRGRRMMPKGYTLTPGSLRSRHEVAAAVGADPFEGLSHAVTAKGALVGADHGVWTLGRQVALAMLAGRPKLQHGLR